MNMTLINYAQAGQTRRRLWLEPASLLVAVLTIGFLQSIRLYQWSHPSAFVLNCGNYWGGSFPDNDATCARRNLLFHLPLYGACVLGVLLAVPPLIAVRKRRWLPWVCVVVNLIAAACVIQFGDLFHAVWSVD